MPSLSTVLRVVKEGAAIEVLPNVDFMAGCRRRLIIRFKSVDNAELLGFSLHLVIVYLTVQRHLDSLIILCNRG